MTWTKHFQRNRKPFFLYILTTFLVSEQTKDQQEKKILQALAYKRLSKAVSDVLEPSEEASLAGRQIKSFQDRKFLLQVYEAQGRFEEAVKLLEDSRTGTESLVGVSKWELTLHYMDLLQTTEQWAKLQETCLSILNQSLHLDNTGIQYGFGQLGDDWKSWQMLIHAHSMDKTTELVLIFITSMHQVIRTKGFRNSLDLENKILSFCGPSPRTAERNARLALLLFCSVEVFEGRRDQNFLLAALSDYFKDFSGKTVCFLDFKPWLSYLNTQGQRQLLVDAANHAQNTNPLSGEVQVSRHKQSKASTD